jgi:inosine-uridine nucleoside N-ribohydrolase
MGPRGVLFLYLSFLFYHTELVEVWWEMNGRFFMEKFKPKIIIDTDPGVDDAMAIMLAVKSDAFDIKAVTTVCGNTTIENTTRNAAYILNIVNASSIPIYSGAEKPLRRTLITGTVMGRTGLGGIQPENKPVLTKNAPEKLAEIVEENPNEITIVAIGPLTNVAKAIAENPEAMNKTKELIIMGGALTIPGNISTAAEFNIFVDPDAAKTVFEFPIKKTLVPLDVCYRTIFALRDFENISDPSLREILIKMVTPYIANLKTNEKVDGAVMYDVLTIYYLLDTQNCGTYKATIQVENQDPANMGRTFVDNQTLTREEEKVTVLDTVDKDRFLNYFLRAFTRKEEL